MLLVGLQGLFMRLKVGKVLPKRSLLLQLLKYIYITSFKAFNALSNALNFIPTHGLNVNQFISPFKNVEREGWWKKLTGLTSWGRRHSWTSWDNGESRYTGVSHVLTTTTATDQSERLMIVLLPLVLTDMSQPIISLVKWLVKYWSVSTWLVRSDRSDTRHVVTCYVMADPKSRAMYKLILTNHRPDHVLASHVLCTGRS